MTKLCVVSMSGGLDSTTLAYKALEDGFTILPINIKYGQKNVVERLAFKNIFDEIKEQFPDQILDYLDLDLEDFLKTSLDLYQELRDSKQVEKATELEFYTPSRNLVFSVLATMIGEVAAIASNLTEIRVGLGVHKHETYKNYWDITPEFVNRLNHLLELNDTMNVSMYAPYASFTKEDIVRDAVRLGVPYKKTWTCYDPVVQLTPNGVKYSPCLKCEACVERQQAGVHAGVSDVNSYQIKQITVTQ